VAAAKADGAPAGVRVTFAAIGLALAVTPACAAELPGGELGFAWGIPFAGLILSIALLPLFAPGFWHARHGLVAAAWSAAFLLPAALTHGVAAAAGATAHVLITEYIPFLALMAALYVISGGFRLRGALAGTPASNTGALAGGMVLASFAGTTGACMVLIRPLLDANAWRASRTHLVVFFIILVGNIGGALTPLGDPPLFVGFLKGVDFFWPTRALFLPMLTTALPLLVAFYALDRWLLARGSGRPPEREPFGIDGSANLALLIAVPVVVLVTGLWTPDTRWVVLGSVVTLDAAVRVAVLLLMVGLSWVLTPKGLRQEIGFTWFPIAEVAKLFFGIFVTLVPVIAMLHAGKDGALASVVALVQGPSGEPNNTVYFWLTGLLSSILDNVPTYIVFFNLAGGDAEALMGPLKSTLVAISAGAVFMGALTYIGNAPNLLVVAIATERGVPVPSFLGYLLWSVPILLPLFALVAWIFL
jgi:Na+/H+ antiporter NhaD/arsenite permease-like protein